MKRKHCQTENKCIPVLGWLFHGLRELHMVLENTNIVVSVKTIFIIFSGMSKLLVYILRSYHVTVTYSQLIRLGHGSLAFLCLKLLYYSIDNSVPTHHWPSKQWIYSVGCTK